jgi:hypothetical protein
VSAPAWNAYDEGYLRAYQWAGALAGGASLPQEAVPVQLGPGEIAHARFAPVSVAGYFGENKEYRSGFFLIGGPVGLALTGAASLARNSTKKREAKLAAIPKWHSLGPADVVVTNQRLIPSANGQTGAFWYAGMSPLAMTAGAGGVPAVQFQPTGQPPLRLETPMAPLIFVFVHHLVDGRPPGVPMPAGVLERAQAQGRLG